MAARRRTQEKPRYVYRSFREGGKVKRRYYGSIEDPLAELVWRSQRLAAGNERAARQKRVAEMEAAKSCEPALKTLASAGDFLLTLPAVLQVPLRMPTKRSEANCSGPELVALVKSIMDVTPTREQLRQLARSAEAGDEQAQLKLELLVGSLPDFRASIGSLGEIARDNLMEAIAGSDPLVKLQLREEMKELAARLGREKTDDPLEQMLIDNVLLTRLDAMRCCIAAVQSQSSRTEYSFWQSMYSRATRRYEKSIDNLQRYRKRN